jgi:hypothetical protein
MRFVIYKKLLREANVICCTADRVMSDYLKGLKFSKILIDEANRMSES